MHIDSQNEYVKRKSLVFPILIILKLVRHHIDNAIQFNLANYIAMNWVEFVHRLGGKFLFLIPQLLLSLGANATHWMLRDQLWRHSIHRHLPNITSFADKRSHHSFGSHNRLTIVFKALVIRTLWLLETLNSSEAMRKPFVHYIAPYGPRSWHELISLFNSNGVARKHCLFGVCALE